MYAGGNERIEKQFIYFSKVYSIPCTVSVSHRPKSFHKQGNILNLSNLIVFLFYTNKETHT